MKIQDENGDIVEYSGPEDELVLLIENKINEVLQEEPFALVCMVGNKGAGKSVLGKFFRKHGLGGFKPREIAVIDDDCMSTYFLWLFRPQISVPCTGVDELEPFFKYCKKRKVIFYISSNPEKRISKASILLRINMADEELRRKRLIKRYGEQKGANYYIETINFTNNPPIHFKHELTLSL